MKDDEESIIKLVVKLDNLTINIKLEIVPSKLMISSVIEYSYSLQTLLKLNFNDEIKRIKKSWESWS